MKRMGSFLNAEKLSRRIRAANYLSVAQLFLQNNFLLTRPLESADIKPRLLGHWGTCPGINLAYACLKDFYRKDKNFSIVIGPGHGYPALQANLFIDGDLGRVDEKATSDLAGLCFVCKNFSWPGGYPSHASPLTPGVICEGGELGYALATAYGYVLGHPERTVAVLIGDGELETATALASLNLNKILAGPKNGKILPILHLNGYKISGPTVSGRKSQRELSEQLRGFGFQPFHIRAESPDEDQLTPELLRSFSSALDKVQKSFKADYHPFLILTTPKGMTGPDNLDGTKISGNYRAHQIPLPNAKTSERELRLLESWLKSYRFNELFDKEKGFKI